MKIIKYLTHQHLWTNHQLDKKKLFGMLKRKSETEANSKTGSEYQKSNGIKGCGLCPMKWAVSTRTTGYLNVPFLLSQLTPSSFDGYCGPVVHLIWNLLFPDWKVQSGRPMPPTFSTTRVVCPLHVLLLTQLIQPTLQLTRLHAYTRY